jgi:hypothetical protein
LLTIGGDPPQAHSRQIGLADANRHSIGEHEYLCIAARRPLLTISALRSSLAALATEPTLAAPAFCARWPDRPRLALSAARPGNAELAPSSAHAFFATLSRRARLAAFALGTPRPDSATKYPFDSIRIDAPEHPLIIYPCFGDPPAVAPSIATLATHALRADFAPRSISTNCPWLPMLAALSTDAVPTWLALRSNLAPLSSKTSRPLFSTLAALAIYPVAAGHSHLAALAGNAVAARQARLSALAV